MKRQEGNWTLSDREMQTVVNSLLVTSSIATYTGQQAETADIVNMAAALKLAIVDDIDIDLELVDCLETIYAGLAKC